MFNFSSDNGFSDGVILSVDLKAGFSLAGPPERLFSRAGGINVCSDFGLSDLKKIAQIK